MKYVNIVTCFLLLQFLFCCSQAATEKKEKKGATDHARIWNNKGVQYSKKGDYTTAIESFLKAKKLNPFEITIVTNLAMAYQEIKKFDEAQKLLNEALNKFIKKSGQKKLQIQIANLHSQWAVNYRSKFDYPNTIKHLEMSYAINKIYRPHSAAIDLNNIGLVYFDLGRKLKALEYYQKALSPLQTAGDKVNTAATLNNIASVYVTIGQHQKALEYFQKTLIIIQALGDRLGEASTLSNIGVMYIETGQMQEALEYLEKALLIFKVMGDKIGKARTENNIGNVYLKLGQVHKAMKYFQDALSIFQTMGHRVYEAGARINIGKIYSDLGKKQKALEYLQEALLLYQTLGNKTEEATTLNNIGSVYYDLGQMQKALEYYERTLPIVQAVESKSGEAKTLNNIGLIYANLFQKKKALDYYEKALSIQRAVDDKGGTAVTLDNMGHIYLSLGEINKGLQCFLESLKIDRKIGNRTDEAKTLNNIGKIYESIGDNHRALEYYEKALPISRAVGNLEREAIILHNMMSALERLNKQRFSTFYGKQSVNLFQELRTNILRLEKKIQRTYLESKKEIYRRLANILIQTGRLSEAQQVLYMLKGEEFFEFIRRDSSYVDNLSTRMDFTKFEKQWIEKYNRVLDKLSTISSEYHLLKFNKNSTEKNRMEQLELRLKEAQKAYEDFLAQLKAAFDKHEKEMKDKPDTTTLAKKASELQTALKYLDETDGGKNAALHYMVYKGRISVIFTTPLHQSVKQTEIDEKEFNVMIANYRNLILDLGKIKRGVQLLETTNNKLEKLFQKKKEYEKKLYDDIFKSVGEELKKYGAANLAISLDGVLRYIPLAALWDGENYLVQKYRMVLVTPSSLKNIKDIPAKDKKILGFGASRGGKEFPPLPYVGREIRSIVKDEENGYYGLMKGKAFLDRDFTKDTMVRQLKNKKFPLVHISSHFKFSPGDETKNHLLLGDGTTLKLSEIRRMGKLFDNVKLLVLSACQTGVGGNGEEIDGFGELAQQSGAKSVIASLWPVADESTKELMVAFYRQLKEGRVTSKIEALRQAQLELAGLDDLLQKDKINVKQVHRQKTKYASSYFWGPFIMIGNWR